MLAVWQHGYSRKFLKDLYMKGETRLQRVLDVLGEIERMRRDGWRWREMNGWVRERIGDPAMSGAAIRQMVSRARRRQRGEGAQS